MTISRCRIIGDYSKLDEECCSATYLPAQDVTAAGSGPSTIAAIERALGGIINDDTFARRISITPGRDYASRVRDWGLSGELNYDLGGAELTSITAYRYNKYTRGQDADFNNLDLLYRASDGGAFNRFKTFSEELRFQGKTFGDKLDWLIGGYYANEKLGVDDNLAYGADYARFGNCLVAANFVGGGAPASLLAPGASPTCFNTPVASGVRASLIGAYNAALAANQFTAAAKSASQIGALSAFARLPNAGLPASIPLPDFSGAPFTNSGFSNLTSPLLTLNNVALNNSYRQTSNNWAIFTHNIFSITDQLKLTLGARYTHEKKSLAATFADNNTICTLLSGSALQQLPCVIPSAPGEALRSTIRAVNRSSWGRLY